MTVRAPAARLARGAKAAPTGGASPREEGELVLRELRTGPATPSHGASSWLAHRARRDPLREAIVDGPTRLTYGQLWARVARAAALLRGIGVRRRDRVATLTMNRVEFVELFYATAELGAMLVPLNWRLAPPELDYQLRDAGATALFVGPEHADLGARLAPDLALGGRIDLGEEYAERRDAAEPWPGSDRDRATFADPHLILYTSGTTGHPKGAVLTHANAFWNVANMAIPVALSELDTTVSVLPMFHSGGVGLYLVPTLTVGGRVVIMRTFDRDGLLGLLARERAALCFGVPSIWLELLRSDRFTKAAYPDLRYVISGGAPMPMAIIDELAGRGFVYLQGYGLTETSPGGTLMPVEDWRRKAGTVGKPAPFVELRVAGDDDRPLATGAIGEVQLRGPNVFAGYWGRPEATAEAFSADGWFRSGDLGSLDDEGFLTLVDRKKDMVITGGENVYSAEVEDVLFAHAAVFEAAIIGLPDAKWGEAVCAVVALKPGRAATAEELVAHCRTRLAKYKTPKYVVFVDSLPRNASGKVLKRQMREEVRPPPGTE
ncbi:MAG: acyl-CoA synthetase [Candidatus Limnocylindria bacterium]